jgi:hypothetical protein
VHKTRKLALEVDGLDLLTITGERYMMTGETSETTVQRPVVGPKMRLPLQAAPIHRTMVASALNDGSGVEPSINWRDVITQGAGLLSSFF